MVAIALIKILVIASLGLEPFAKQLAHEILPVAQQAIPVVQQAVAAEKKDQATDKKQPASTAKNATNAETPPPGITALDWKALKKREEELNRRARALKTLEQELDQKLKKLTELEGRIKKMLEQADATKDKKVKHLVAVYTNMKSKNAASVIEKLDMELAVKILSGMNGRKAGEILGYVEPAKAAKISQALTNLNIPFQ